MQRAVRIPGGNKLLSVILKIMDFTSALPLFYMDHRNKSEKIPLDRDGKKEETLIMNDFTPF